MLSIVKSPFRPESPWINQQRLWQWAGLSCAEQFQQIQNIQATCAPHPQRKVVYAAISWQIQALFAALNARVLVRHAADVLPGEIDRRSFRLWRRGTRRHLPKRAEKATILLAPKPNCSSNALLRFFS